MALTWRHKVAGSGRSSAGSPFFDVLTEACVSGFSALPYREADPGLPGSCTSLAICVSTRADLLRSSCELQGCQDDATAESEVCRRAKARCMGARYSTVGMTRRRSGHAVLRVFRLCTGLGGAGVVSAANSAG